MRRPSSFLRTLKSGVRYRILPVHDLTKCIHVSYWAKVTSPELRLLLKNIMRLSTETKSDITCIACEQVWQFCILKYILSTRHLASYDNFFPTHLVVTYLIVYVFALINTCNIVIHLVPALPMFFVGDFTFDDRNW
jgi:hypothetical protein